MAAASLPGASPGHKGSGSARPGGAGTAPREASARRWALLSLLVGAAEAPLLRLPFLWLTPLRGAAEEAPLAFLLAGALGGCGAAALRRCLAGGWGLRSRDGRFRDRVSIS